MIIALMLVASTATAQTKWTLVDESANDDRFYIRDVRRTGRIVTSWHKRVSIDGSYTISRDQNDCTNDRHRMSEIKKYDGNGKMIKSGLHGKWSQWFDVLPDSSGEVMHRRLCALNR